MALGPAQQAKILQSVWLRTERSRLLRLLSFFTHLQSRQINGCAWCRLGSAGDLAALRHRLSGLSGDKNFGDTAFPLPSPTPSRLSSLSLTRPLVLPAQLSWTYETSTIKKMTTATTLLRSPQGQRSPGVAGRGQLCEAPTSWLKYLSLITD
ncbi:hypothetical protein RRG08_015188 [Elysia crispata]|uniref:Uncharacterized protein n=1 Tax=Elysia crispata TaxID=231223 RepID=A0AAE1E6R2_9GAST|nr:hypothetical protein RRG08_015188 [Elysia crispata]